jgi:hypothetical protein
LLLLEALAWRKSKIIIGKLRIKEILVFIWTQKVEPNQKIKEEEDKNPNPETKILYKFL